MKKGPFQLQQPDFVIVDVRAHPHDQERVSQELPISVQGRITYDIDGEHFIMLTISQESEEYAYSFKIQVIATFKLDIEEARKVYKPLNPATVGVNVARVLYSGAREMLAVVSSRGPYGAAMLPTIFLEPSDIGIDFEGKHEEILSMFFDFDAEQIEELNKAIAAKKAAAKKASGPRKASKTRS